MLDVTRTDLFQPRKSTRRDPWTEDEARETLAAAGRSGLSLAAFARRHGLSDRQLYWWRMRLRAHRDVDRGRPTSFVPVTLTALDDDETGIEVVVGGAVVRVDRGFCELTLARTVAVLRSLPC